jgi:hypothetical protein
MKPLCPLSRFVPLAIALAASWATVAHGQQTAPVPNAQPDPPSVMPAPGPATKGARTTPPPAAAATPTGGPAAEATPTAGVTATTSAPLYATGTANGEASIEPRIRPFADVPSEETIIVPRYDLLTSGAAFLAVSYLPSVVVGAESHREGDTNLFIPVFGPWFDLIARPPCSVTVPCGGEGLAKVALVADGVLQTAGALQVALALLVPHRHVVLHAKTDRFAVDFTPSRLGTGYGMAALGTF